MITKADIREREQKMVLAHSPAGAIEKVANLKKRQRSVYYRPFVNEDETVSWMPTLPLPSDALGRELYLSKGFRLKPPATDTIEELTVVDPEKDNLIAENARLRRLLEEKQKGRPKKSLE